MKRETRWKLAAVIIAMVAMLALLWQTMEARSYETYCNTLIEQAINDTRDECVVSAQPATNNDYGTFETHYIGDHKKRNP